MSCLVNPAEPVRLGPLLIRGFTLAVYTLLVCAIWMNNFLVNRALATSLAQTIEQQQSNPQTHNGGFKNRIVPKTDSSLRIAALSPHIVEILYDLGLGQHIVVTATGSDFPETARHHPQLNAHAAINLEALLAFKPDWVLAWPFGQALKLEHQLAPFGIEILYSNPQSFSELAQEYLRFVELFKHHKDYSQAQARALTKYRWINTQLQKLTELYSVAQYKSSAGVFFMINSQPLRTLNNDHLIVEIVQRCGGTNLFGETSAKAPLVSAESVIQSAPHVIILSEGEVNAKQKLQFWRNRFKVPALDHGHWLEVHPDFLHRPSVRTLQVAKSICQNIADSLVAASR